MNCVYSMRCIRQERFTVARKLLGPQAIELVGTVLSTSSDIYCWPQWDDDFIVWGELKKRQMIVASTSTFARVRTIRLEDDGKSDFDFNSFFNSILNNDADAENEGLSDWVVCYHNRVAFVTFKYGGQGEASKPIIK